MNKFTNIFIIIQSVLLCIVLAIAVIGMNNESAKGEKIEYERIKADLEKVIHSLKVDVQISKDETLLLIHKVDSMRGFLPKHEKSLGQIKNELKKINDETTVINYNDSTSSAIMHRLSR